MMGFGRLYPQSPYMSRINILHVPSVESTLLLTFTRGTKFLQSAPFVFQDTLKDTLQYFEYGNHITDDDDGTTLGDFLDTASIPTLGDCGWTIPAEHVLWYPASITDSLKGNPAGKYKILISLFFRVNGAYSMLQLLKKEMPKGRFPANDTTTTKVVEFLDRHLALLKRVDALHDPNDTELSKGKWNVKSGGPTLFPQDKDSFQVVTKTVPREYTPLQVIKHSGVLEKYELSHFSVPTEQALGSIAFKIRATMDDKTLVRLYVGEETQEAFDFFYPVVMKSAQECREHSWYLACLTMINSAWTEIAATDEDADVPMDKHSITLQYAFHRCMGSYVQLMFHSMQGGDPSQYKISDEHWRPVPDGSPTMLDLYFPHDTVCFHAGDLPSVGIVFDQVGLKGVHVVKNKIPLVKMLMKSLPVCCQSRDLVGTLIDECRAENSDGFWRVIRTMFFCTFAGLYPHARRRVDFRSMLRIYGLLFHNKEKFLQALEKESLDNELSASANGTSRRRWKKQKKSGTTGATPLAAKAPPDDETVSLGSDPSVIDTIHAGGAPYSVAKRDHGNDNNNKTSQLVYIVFREFFIHSVRMDSEWLTLVNQVVNWDSFVVKTVYMADQMRKYGRFADGPEGNELLFAINALWRYRNDQDKDTYHYRKKTYEGQIIEKINLVQDELNAKRLMEADNAKVLSVLLDRFVRNGILEYSDISLLYRTEEIKELKLQDPFEMYNRNSKQFITVLKAQLLKSEEDLIHLSCTIEPQIKDNIIRFLMNTEPKNRFRFDSLLDPRLGAVRRESVQIMFKTKQIYEKRSSPKSLETNIRNLSVRDLRIFSWYFNILNRLDDIKLLPLPVDMVSRQANAVRKRRFHLLDHEKLPDHAWTVYITICCGRLATFANTYTYGNFAMSYDPNSRNMVCSKKIAKTARNRNKAKDPETMVKSDSEKKTKTEKAIKQKARIERKDDSVLSCGGQPMIPIDIYGCMLLFGEDRYLFCPECGQFHTYHSSNWGRNGYMCSTCRSKDIANNTSMKLCASCGLWKRDNEMLEVDVIRMDRDPCDENFDPIANPGSCYQRINMCHPDANSAGVFKHHHNEKLYLIWPKEKYWHQIAPLNTKRIIKYAEKYK